MRALVACVMTTVDPMGGEDRVLRSTQVIARFERAQILKA